MPKRKRGSSKFTRRVKRKVDRTQNKKIREVRQELGLIGYKPRQFRQPFPETMKVKLVYQDALSSSAGIGFNTLQQWKVNSPYDPDYTNAGRNQQPLYFDQLMSVTGPYTQYRPRGYTIDMTVSNVGSSTLEVAFQPWSLTTSLVDTFAEIQSFRNRNHTFMLDSSVGGKSHRRIKKTVWFDKYLHDSVAADTLSASYGASPTQLVYATLIARDIAGSAAPSLVCSYKLTLYLELSQTRGIISA